MYNIVETLFGFDIVQGTNILLSHTMQNSCFFIGIANAKIEEYRGNFQIKDRVEQRIPLKHWKKTEDGIVLYTSDKSTMLKITIQSFNCQLHLKGELSDKNYNRIWIKLNSQEGERIYGAGEQFSHFNLKGHSYEIFTREQGVGRNKATAITFEADKEKAGGDYDWTFFPQPTFVSSLKYFVHLENYCYISLDFTQDNFHEIEIWDNKFSLATQHYENFKCLLKGLTQLLGNQPKLPKWAFEGIWLGIQGGTEIVEEKVQYMKKYNTHITAVWCQDWQGVRHTSFGKRLMWNWEYDNELYHNLPFSIKKYNNENIRFMGYINPYLCVEKKLFKIAKSKGFLVLNNKFKEYIIDFGEFYCGIVDFTNPNACEWYKNEVIKKNMIDIGLEGWMADFGEYLPVDCLLHNKQDAISAHNEWPLMWAKINYDALKETGNLGKIAVFFRAGCAGIQKYSPLMWAGDQNVDWSLDDGLITVVVAALSSGMSGHGMHTSDIGGYTTLYGMKRTKELLCRWAEFSAFTPVMRTHEGNRPDDNWQFDSDEQTAKFISRFSRIHTQLSEYNFELMQINHSTGLPAMRAMFIEYPNIDECYDLEYQYMLGEDLIIAPAYTQGARDVKIFIPDNQWINIWTGEKSEQGFNTVQTPLGFPAVYYRENSKYEQDFKLIKKIEQ